MLEAIKILQKEKISDIIYIAKNKESVTFKSPTGSGKTIMMLDLMNRYLGDDKKLIFIVSSLSKAQLA
jgi:type III restriction enzyme